VVPSSSPDPPSPPTLSLPVFVPPPPLGPPNASPHRILFSITRCFARRAPSQHPLPPMEKLAPKRPPDSFFFCLPGSPFGSSKPSRGDQKFSLHVPFPRSISGPLCLSPDKTRLCISRHDPTNLDVFFFPETKRNQGAPTFLFQKVPAMCIQHHSCFPWKFLGCRGVRGAVVPFLARYVASWALKGVRRPTPSSAQGLGGGVLQPFSVFLYPDSFGPRKNQFQAALSFSSPNFGCVPAACPRIPPWNFFPAHRHEPFVFTPPANILIQRAPRTSTW